MPRLGAGMRRIAAVALITLGSLFLLLGMLSIYVERNLLDADRFADRAVTALDDDATRAEVGSLVADQLEQQVDPNLVAYRAIVEAVVSGLADTAPFKAALRTGIVDAHKVAFGKGRDSAAVTIANFGVLADGALRAFSPKAAKEVPDGFRADLISLSEAGIATDFVQLELGELPWLAPLLALVFLALGALAANDRRAGVTGAAIGVALVGAVLVIGYEVGLALAAGGGASADAEAAVRSLWSAMLGDLRDWSLVLCFGGAVIAGASASLLRPADARERLRRLAGRATQLPASGAGKAARAAAMLALGVFVLVSPDLAVRIVAVVVGLGLAYVGASELLAMIAGPPREPGPEGRARRSVGRAAALAAVAAAAILALVLVARNDDTGTPDAPSGCNGSEALCDRTIDQVTFPASHNSMAAAGYPGFLFPMHDATIPQQLADGVRGLLIDAYYGYPGRRVYTDFDRSPNKLREQAEAELGPEFVGAADRVRETIARPEGESKLYLCHGFCEMGAIDLVDTLREIDSFVEQNPNEVLMIVIEDYVDPADIVDAFERSGLAEHVYDGPLGPEFPTLQELIDTDQRVIVSAENRAGEAPWYRLAYDSFQETGYDFKRPQDMDCAPNRGAAHNPLFLINNWINTDPAAKPTNAAEVNALDFLLGRARRCARERDLHPNLIAVDFYAEGDLVEVAERLNESG